LAFASMSYLKVWDAETGKELHSLQTDGAIFSLAFSPDGKRIASGTDRSTVKIWDAETGQELHTVKLTLISSNNTPIWCVAFSPDGKHLAAGAAFFGQLKIMDAHSFSELRTIKAHMAQVQAMAFSPDGKRLASSGAGNEPVKLWDVETGQ